MSCFVLLSVVNSDSHRNSRLYEPSVGYWVAVAFHHSENQIVVCMWGGESKEEMKRRRRSQRGTKEEATAKKEKENSDIRWWWLTSGENNKTRRRERMSAIKSMNSSNHCHRLFSRESVIVRPKRYSFASFTWVVVVRERRETSDASEGLCLWLEQRSQRILSNPVVVGCDERCNGC